MKALFNISMDFRNILKEIEDNEGQLTPELEQALAISQAELQEKGVHYGYAIKEFEANREVIKKEIERLKKLDERNEYMANKLEEKIKGAMIEFGVEKIESATLKLSLRTSYETVITNADVIPEKYLTPKTTYTPNKRLIKDHIEAGLAIDGAYIKENKNLSIK